MKIVNPFKWVKKNLPYPHNKNDHHLPVLERVWSNPYTNQPKEKGHLCLSTNFKTPFPPYPPQKKQLSTHLKI